MLENFPANVLSCHWCGIFCLPSTPANHCDYYYQFIGVGCEEDAWTRASMDGWMCAGRKQLSDIPDNNNNSDPQTADKQLDMYTWMRAGVREGASLPLPKALFFIAFNLH